jgi:hypothetical protein
MIFAAEIGLDRIHSHGNVKNKLSKKEDSRSEFTPFFPKFTSNEGSLLASDTQRIDTFMKQPQQKIFGCSNSIGSCESENDPLARCLAEIEDMDKESMDSLDAKNFVPTKRVSAKEF